MCNIILPVLCYGDTHHNSKGIQGNSSTLYYNITAVDTTGVLVSKAAELFLCNDLLPPHYHKIVSKNKEHENTALKVAEESVDRALVAEPIHNGGITLQPYW